MDMRGYADSEKPTGSKDYEIDNMVSDIRELVNKFEKKTVTLVCHDWGAVIGWRYVLKHMDTIERYVMIGAAPLEVYARASATNWDQFQKGWYVHFFKVPFVPEMACRANDMQLLNAMKGKHTNDEDIEAYKYYFGQPNAFTYGINYYRQNGQKGAIKRLESAPTNYKKGLFLLGEKERYISLSCGPMTEKYYPNVTYKMVPNTNHFAQQDDYEVVNKMMREFLAEK